jgi:hypothetical protein
VSAHPQFNRHVVLLASVLVNMISLQYQWSPLRHCEKKSCTDYHICQGIYIYAKSGVHHYPSDKVTVPEKQDC